MADTSMLISSGAVRGAYRNSQDLSAERQALSEQPKTSSFSDMLAEASQRAVASAKETDQVIEAGLKGAISTQQVVEATIALESSVKVAVSVRDKFVSAYQEILRMPI